MLLSANVSNNKIKEEAIRILKSSEGKAVIMMGHPIDVKPTDPSQTTPVESTCDGCQTPVWSTKLKEELKSISSEAKLLCGKCLKAALM